jgi:hypothetical protein
MTAAAQPTVPASILDSWTKLVEPGGYAGSYGRASSRFAAEGIEVEAHMDARHPDADLAVVRLLREYMSLHPEYGEFTMERVTKPTLRKHGNHTSVDAYFFADARGFEKWTTDRAAGHAT